MLYVYENREKRERLKDKYSTCKFVGSAFFIQGSDNIMDVISFLEDEKFENYVVDITNWVKDGNFFKVYSERYFEAIREFVENVSFCIKNEYLSEFLEWHPDFFEADEIDTEFAVSETTGIEESHNKSKNSNYEIPKEIYVYNDVKNLTELIEGEKILSIGELVEKYEGVILQYDINKIMDRLLQNIEYIDISSIVRMLNLRGDIVLSAEVLILKISQFYKNRFCINKELLDVLCEKFPFYFTNHIEILNTIPVELIENVNISPDIESVKLIADKINNILKGHDDFKHDFKRNLLKYSFLNNMGERKIFSLILCGESGIGKTEFAKIASEVMYPNEDLIKINFGNYSNEGVLNSLIGSPLGYIGSEDGGELINKIEKSKSKIILIDEFEKATPSVYNFFYELLEDGIFTDRHGRKHDLNGYIIVFTSNMNKEQYQKHIPDSLKSRFDMVYYFVDIPADEKESFIHESAVVLSLKLKEQFGYEVKIDEVKEELDKLMKYKNLRNIKRKVEDIIFNKFFENEET